jgi:hypothetical protein
MKRNQTISFAHRHVEAYHSSLRNDLIDFVFTFDGEGAIKLAPALCN